MNILKKKHQTRARLRLREKESVCMYENKSPSARVITLRREQVAFRYIKRKKKYTKTLTYTDNLRACAANLTHFLHEKKKYIYGYTK